MTTKMKFGLIALASVLIVGLCTFFSMTGWFNDATELQNTTKAQVSSNRNGYDNFWKTVKESAQIPDKYKEDFKELLVSEATAKYGPEGSKATMQWFQERNLQFDSSMYRKLQDIIESGRQDFRRSQDILLDKQRKMTDMTTSYWGSMLAKHYGFPHHITGELAPERDLDGDGKKTVLDYPIVTSARTDTAFRTGKDDEINVFGK